MNLSRRIVLITGCSDGGLGSALASAFHKAHWRVLATARDTSKITTLNIDGIELLELDVTSETSLQACLEAVKQKTSGRLDMLLNNAGGGYYMPVSDIEMSSVRTLFEVNVYSAVRTSQVFLPLLLANPGGAMIVNHTSGASILCGPFSGAYNASKAALAAFTSSMRLELAPFSIKVIDLKTGGVVSNFYSNISANHHARKLPNNSLYSFAREDVDYYLSGAVIRDQNSHEADVWAARVVTDLIGANPPDIIYRGKLATAAWFSSFLPSWMTDGALKRLVGLDKVETKLAERKDDI